MLARASSDAGTRLRRSKSTSTVHRHPPPILEPLDPDVARKHAVAAATAAFARTQTHDVSERKSKRSSELSRSKSNASRKSNPNQGQGSHFPPRESSFRSVQHQRTGQATTTQRRSRASTINTEKFPSFYHTSSVDRPVSAPRPLSTQPSLSLSEDHRPSTQPKSNRISAASSITSQQIRKARSMYYASSVQTGSPIARPPAKYLTTPPPVSVTPVAEPALTIPPSRSVGPSPLAGPRIPVTVTTSETIDKARDRYLQDFQHRSVKQKPSLLLAPFQKRRNKSKGQGKEQNSRDLPVSLVHHQSPDDPTVDFTLSDFLPQPEKKEKRSFSGSLKSKFKRVFRRTSRDSTSLPIQQIEASREYFGTRRSSITGLHSHQAVPSPEDDLLQRAHSRTPSLEHFHAAFMRSASRNSSNGSVHSSRSQRSLHSEVKSSHPSASRATSWGTSMTEASLAQRAIKRLTVIHESKDSIGSEADRPLLTSTKRKSLPSNALAAFRDPMPMEGLLEESSTPVDPKRVFSALMKEITTAQSVEDTVDTTNRTPGAESDVFESSKTKELYSSTSSKFRPSTASEYRPPSRRPPSAAAQSVQSKTSSMRSIGRAIRSTIRNVSPGEHCSSPCPHKPTMIKGFVPVSTGITTTSSRTATPSLEKTNISAKECTREQTPSLICPPSATQIERRVERAKQRWKTPLDDAEKLQFPRETNRTYDVASFAQRIGVDKASDGSLSRAKPQCTEDTQRGCDIGTHNMAPVSPISTKIQSIMSPLSPSIYSRNTDGMSILPNDSVLSFESQEHDCDTDGGSAIIITSQSVRSYVVGTPSPRRSESGRTSQDWRAWLSHEVSSMECISQEDLKIDTSYLVSPREGQQSMLGILDTDHGDTTVIFRKSSDTPTEVNSSLIGTSTRPTQPNAVSPHVGDCPTENLTPVFEKSKSHPDTFKEVSPAHTPRTTETMPALSLPLRPRSTPVLSQQRLPSTPSQTSSSQSSLHSPKSARMNDRFPYLNARRPSDTSRTLSSCHSKSPAESIASSKNSSKAIPDSRVYSDLSVLPSGQPALFSHNTVARRRNLRNSKENLSPPSLGALGESAKTNMSSSGLTPRKRYSQPLLSPVVNSIVSGIKQRVVEVPEARHMKHMSSPVTTPFRTCVRATLRPALAENIKHRPRSAFDLRSSYITKPRPASELRRPAIHSRFSTSPSATTKEPTPSPKGQSIGAKLGNDGRGTASSPGQRMADRFLKERRSAGVLEGGKYRAGLRLVREDTPAFL